MIENCALYKTHSREAVQKVFEVARGNLFPKKFHRKNHRREKYMYIHIGAGYVVREQEMIGCFDMDGRHDSEVNKEFLKAAERSGRTVSAGDDLPRTFVLTDSRVIFTHISTAAVCERTKIGKSSARYKTGSSEN